MLIMILALVDVAKCTCEEGKEVVAECAFCFGVLTAAVVTDFWTCQQ